MDVDADVHRMRAIAAGFLSDAAILGRGIVTASDGYLLRLLAFEVLLKALVLAHGAQPGPVHKYAVLWSHLPSALQSRLQQRAADRMATSADYSDLNAILEVLSRNFVKLRYPV